MQADATIGIVSNNLANTILAPNESYSLGLQLKNFSSQVYNNITVNLACNHPAIVIDNPNATITSLNPEATVSVNFLFITTGAIKPGAIIDFTVTLNNPSVTCLFQLVAGGAKIQVINYEGVLEIGQANNITFTVTNLGNFTMEDIVLQIQALTPMAVAQSDPVAIGSLAPNEIKQFTATITLMNDSLSRK